MDSNNPWDCPRCDQVNEPSKRYCDCGLDATLYDRSALARMRKAHGTNLIIVGLLLILIGSVLLLATLFRGPLIIIWFGIIAMGCSLFAKGYRARRLI
jgi:hypothetical protein